MSFQNSVLLPRSHFSSGTGTGSLWSLRTELMASHMILVTLIVMGFGGLMFWIAWHTTYRQAEADLLAAAQLLIQDLSLQDGSQTLDIPDTYLHRFGKAPRDHAYVVLWDAAGHQLAGSNPLPKHVSRSVAEPPRSGPHPFLTRTSGRYLDIIVATPQQGQLLIGRPLAKEFDALSRLLGEFLLIGLVFIGLGGGAAWWLAKRIAEPISRIAARAHSLNSRNLDQRLTIGRTNLEVTHLALAFNDMLDSLHLAFERQNRFTADASHELRTPVAIILSQTEYSLARERSPQDYKSALQTCLQSAQRMKRLVDDLLLLSRVDNGHFELHRELVDLSDIAQSSILSLQLPATELQLHFETQLAPTLLLGDSFRLEQVIMNLVTNALYYNVPGGEVLVTVRPDGQSALLIVQDHGQGIAPEDQSRIFERFYRVDQSRTLAGESRTGLGLSLVAEIVSAHGGTIHIDSAVGQGTTMTVRFPLAARAG